MAWYDRRAGAYLLKTGPDRRTFSRIFRKKLGWERANYQDSNKFLSIHSMFFMNFYDVCTFSFSFFCKIELHGQQNHNNKEISIPAYSAGSSWSAIFQILPHWNIFHCKILAVRYFHWSPWWLYNFQVWYYSSKKARQDPISPRQNWDNFREINAIGKMSRPPALGELHSPVLCGPHSVAPTVDWELLLQDDCCTSVLLLIGKRR